MTNAQSKRWADDLPAAVFHLRSAENGAKVAPTSNALKAAHPPMCDCDLTTRLSVFSIAAGLAGVITIFVATFLSAKRKTEVTIQLPTGHKAKLTLGGGTGGGTLDSVDLENIVKTLRDIQDDKHASRISGDANVRQ